jgi:dUTP pyrophosphatase
MKLRVKKLVGEAIIPKYANKGDAGVDLHSVEDLTIIPGEIKLVKTGLAFEIPEGYEMQLRPRSGLALKNGISLVNSPGTIDSGYRGEVGLILINHGKLPLEVKKGDRIAQAVFNKVETVLFDEVNELSLSERGEGGFGSSGIKK